MDHILFSDEATFHVCGRVNTQCCRIWSKEKPKEFWKWERDSPKVNVWMGRTKTKIYGPFLFVEPSVTAITYLDMLEQWLDPQLVADGIADTVVFQQDGASCHFAW